MAAAPKALIPRSTSKKQQIYDALLEQIRDQTLPVGTRIPSAPEMAEEWQVSYGTMHAALTELTREGWLVRYPKFGTFVAAPPPKPEERAAMKAAVVVLPPREDIIASGNRSEVFEILQGLSEGAHTEGWQVRMELLPSVAGAGEMEAIVSRLREASGAVFVGHQYQALAHRLADSGFPVVCLLNSNPSAGDLITYDRTEAVDLAVTHLCRQGRQKIGFLGDLRDPFGKYDAFLRVLQREGRSAGPALDARCAQCVPLKDAEAAICRMLDGDFDADAIFAVNYQTASLFAWQAKMRGIRIPEEVALMAYGIEENESLPLTYVRIPYFEIGQEAARLLACNHGKPPTKKSETIVLKPALVRRGSCGALRDC